MKYDLSLFCAPILPFCVFSFGGTPASRFILLNEFKKNQLKIIPLAKNEMKLV